jgi:hypothetical protein
MGSVEAQVNGVNPTATGDGQRLGRRSAPASSMATWRWARNCASSRRRARRWCGACRRGAGWQWHGLGDRPCAARRAAAVRDAVRDDGAGAVRGLVRGRRAAGEREGRALRRRSGPAGVAGSAAAGRAGWIILDAALAQQFSAWPHFVSTAPGVAYAYVPDYLRNRPDVTVARRPAGAGAQAGHGCRSARRSLRRRRAAPLGAGPMSRSGRCARCSCMPKAADGGPAASRARRGRPAIPGLYAAGSTGQGGLLLKGHGHHLAWAFVSGRRAGRLAAQAAASSPVGLAPAGRRQRTGSPGPRLAKVPRMELRQLRYFVRVVELGSISRAALDLQRGAVGAQPADRPAGGRTGHAPAAAHQPRA